MGQAEKLRAVVHPADCDTLWERVVLGANPETQESGGGMLRPAACLTLFLLFSVLVAVPGWCDEVQLGNGDWISGQVLSMEQGELKLETPYAGTITIQWDQVAGLRTQEPVHVLLSDEASMKGRSVSAKWGRMRLKMGRVEETVSFDLAEVQAINPEAEEKPAVELSGRVDVSLTRSRGNTDTESHHVAGEIVARTEKNRYTAGIEYNREENEDVLTSKNYLGYAKYDHFLSRKWYGYINTLFEKDEFKDIRLRSTVGTGVGYQFFESELTNLYLETGLSFVNEDREEGEDDDSMAGRWAISFDRYFLNKSVQFFHTHEGYQSLDESEDLFIRSRTGLRFPLSAGFRATLQYNYDWDNDPAPGEENEDEKYLVTLGYEF
jgi:putative salt-induced outer membrane protein YdiY